MLSTNHCQLTLTLAISSTAICRSEEQFYFFCIAPRLTVDGSTPSGSSAYEKRGIAVDIPIWQPDNCIQCNRCAYVCPHAVIRPVALTEEEAANAPEGMQSIPMIGMPDMKFAITVSAYDCTGCGSCANVCPGKKGEKALVMGNMEENAGKQTFFDYGREIPVKPEVVAKYKETTVKGSQFKQPLLEFSELVRDVERHRTQN